MKGGRGRGGRRGGYSRPQSYIHRRVQFAFLSLDLQLEALGMGYFDVKIDRLLHKAAA